ncbi:MAG: elongation factor G [Candidatus Eisenbacteria bacterium]|uniref:Elongation factor G n=1 Tax=Eiseniibacteriota bacterium TaxID=2212470 RepID=A0A938BPI7_UNCEI|nr:elongation factor G [Candidatus Eisenbacteria bacterium]
MQVKQYDTAKIRNVVLLGHGASGKTLLAESILFATGAASRRGNPADGTSTLDGSPEEIKRKMSLSLALAPVEWEGCKINFLDAPGSGDFVGEAEAGLHAADLALILVNGTAGVEVDTDRFFEMAQEAGKPVCFVVNQLDREQADFARSLQAVQGELSERAVPFMLPTGAGPAFQGLIDLVAGKAYADAGKGRSKPDEVPGALQGQLDEIRGRLAEAAAETDDGLLEKYLEAGALAPEEIQRGLREGFHKGKLFPVLAVSAETMTGIDRLLEFLREWAPSPLDAPPALARREGQAEPAPLSGRTDGAPVAFVFKTHFDERLGEYTVLRVYSGVLAPGDYYNVRKETGVRVGSLYALRGRERIDLDSLPCGDIGVTPRIKNVATNDTLAAKDNRVLVEPIGFSEPLHTVAVVPAVRGEEEKVASGFVRLADLDPTFRMRVDSALRQTLVSGMGDQHLDVMIERFKARSKIDLETRKPRIPYRETIQKTIDDIQGKHKKQTGGRGQYGDVHLKIEPLPRGGGFEFVDAIVGGVVPGKFIPAVEKGIRECLERGVLVGCPVVDVRATLHYGSYHDVDSSEQAFKTAASIGFKEGFLKCQPILLEPIMKLEIFVPEAHTGDIMGDMSSRRGRILGMERAGRRQKVQAIAPLGELFGYNANLRSMTQGRGRFRMEMSHYEEVPREVQDKLVESLRKEMDETKA